MSSFDPDNVEKSLEFLPKDTRNKVIDTVYCDIHNAWSAIKGNTPESDIEWFARWLCGSFNHRGYDWLDENEQRFWKNLSEQCIRGLPMLMSRMEMRYEAYKDALHVMLKSEWAAKEAAKDKDTTP